MIKQTSSASLQHPLLSTVAFRHANLVKSIGAANALGYCGIELWENHLKACTPEVWDAEDSALREKNMTLPVVAPFLSFTHGLDRLAQTWKDAEHALRVAEENFRLNFQFIPSFLKEGWEAALRQFLPYTAPMHWQQVQSDGRMGYLSECGRIDLSRIACILAGSKYEGTAGREYCGPDIGGDCMRADS
jgi:sugar phosphate isomerase/epimerase